MSSIPLTHNGVNNNGTSLRRRASVLGGYPHEPAMSADEIVEMLAWAVADDDLYALAREHLAVGHFRGGESGHQLLWTIALELWQQRSARPCLDAIRQAIEQRLIEAANTGEVVPGVQAAGELCSRIGSIAVASGSPANGRALLQKFLLEREVFLPLADAVRSTSLLQTVPVEFSELLRLATDQVEAIRESCGNDSWGAPEPLDGCELPPFPVDVLPCGFRQWVHAEAIATQTPPDLAALVGLCCFAAGAAKVMEVQVRPGWCEPLNLFVAVVMEPGSRKSAVFADATAPLRAFEREVVDRMTLQVRQYQRNFKILEDRVTYLRKAAAKAKASDRPGLVAQIDEAELELASLQRVVEPKIIADDITAEKLEALLGEQGGRVAVLSAEGGVFDLMAGRYSKAANFDAFLKAHAGDEIRVDRLSREPVYVARPALTVGLAVQPEVLRKLGGREDFRGLGLLARFLYAIPQSMVGRREIEPPAVSGEIRRTYEQLCWSVCRMVRAGVPSTTLEPRYLALSQEARTILLCYQAQTEQRLAPLGELAAIADWGGKLAGAVARLAGILHVVEQANAWLQQQGRVSRLERTSRPHPWDTEISQGTMEAAIAIGEYLVPHAQAAFAAMSLATSSSAQVVADAWHAIDWICRQRRASFSRTELQQANRSRFPRASMVEPPLELLEAKGYVRAVNPPAVGPKGGRPPAARYRVNPCVLADGFRAGYMDRTSRAMEGTG